MRFTVVQSSMDLRNIPISKSNGGDFSPTPLAAAVNSPQMNEFVVNTWQEKAGANGMYPVSVVGILSKFSPQKIDTCLLCQHQASQ